MDGVRRKRGQTNGEVFRPFGIGSTVLDPLSGIAHDGLAGTDVEHSTPVSDPQASLQDYGEFGKLRSLPRLNPASRTAHMGDAHLAMLGIDPTDVLVDQFRLI